MKPYPLQLEISGPTAMWTRPDTGSSPVSYVAPTFSAVKGIFESVLRWKSVKGGAGDSPAPVGDPPTGIPSPHWGEGGRRPDEVRRTDSQTAPGEVSNPNFSNARPFRPETRVCEIENHELPTLLRMVFDQAENPSNN